MFFVDYIYVLCLVHVPIDLSVLLSASHTNTMFLAHSNPNFLVAVSKLGVFVSASGGVNTSAWALCTNGLNMTAGSDVANAANAVASVVSNAAGTRVIWVGYAQSGCTYSFYWSVNSGASFTAFTNAPGTIDTPGGVPTFVGLGQQCNPNFALLGDPNNLNLVYVGGTNQLNHGTSSGLNAKKYSGRLFRGNRTSGIWSALTHTGTASLSAPHSDSRFLAWDNGRLLHSNDGGIYARTLPATNAGDWFTLNGDLALSEYSSAHYDASTDVFVAGMRLRELPLVSSRT